MGFRGHLERAYLGCSVYMLQETFAFGTGLLEMPFVRFSGGIWYGPTGGALCRGFRGHLIWRTGVCPVYLDSGGIWYGPTVGALCMGFREVFGAGLLGVPSVWFLNGIWYGHTGGALCKCFMEHLAIALWVAICVGFSGVVGICLMRLPCVSATAEAVGIGILGIPHVLTFGGCWYRPTGGIYRLHGLLLVWVYEGPP